jgi:uncharacterized protein YdiU (UPF0061 family)
MISFNNSYAHLPESFYARTAPDKVAGAKLVRLNQGLCKELGLDATWLESSAGLAMLSGSELPESAEPVAMAYGGHQFGGWSPRLGDGRAILLGEVLDRNGIRKDIQLKGSGRTPFSRGGDGKATLGAIVREYLLSESMFALGVPTTRALAVVTTGEPVYRETPLPGAILTRVAQSHVRVGTFQYFAAQQDHKSLARLADYVIERHYPEALETANPYRGLLESVLLRQAQLIARWMQLGFIHGVMNTDNMQIAGETIDYGPCAFMDDFHPKCVFSSIDRNGRYAWDQQPSIAKWNLTRLAEAMLPLLAPDQELALEVAAKVLELFDDQFNKAFLAGFKRKLGLLDDAEPDAEFLASTLVTLANEEVDFTLFFRQLTRHAGGATTEPLCALFARPEAGEAWLASWHERIDDTPTRAETRAAVMRGVNPIFIARNHRVEEAIVAADKNDFEPFHKLVAILERPYEEQAEHAEYEQAPLENEKVRETFCGT